MVLKMIQIQGQEIDGMRLNFFTGREDASRQELKRSQTLPSFPRFVFRSDVLTVWFFISGSDVLRGTKTSKSFHNKTFQTSLSIKINWILCSFPPTKQCFCSINLLFFSFASGSTKSFSLPINKTDSDPSQTSCMGWKIGVVFFWGLFALSVASKAASLCYVYHKSWVSK